MMELAITGTLYSTFCAFLLFPHFDAPRLLSRAAMALCALELMAAIGWSATHQHCGGITSGDAVFSTPCPTITSVFAGAVAILTAIFFVASLAHGLLTARKWYSRADSDLGYDGGATPGSDLSRR